MSLFCFGISISLRSAVGMSINPVLCLQLAEALAEADVALFPNRGEGGTNLMAMQAMASGVPTVLSANSGMNVSVVHWLRTVIF